MSFVSLHVHTEMSLLDGVSKRRDLIRRAVEFGMPALAVTEHGNMFQSVSFIKECRKAGIKPIQGTEFYVAPDSRFGRKYASAHKLKSGEVDIGDVQAYAYHLTVLARNQEGYRNLIRLNTLAYREGFYRKPRIDMEILAEYSEGLVVLSGCLGSLTSQLIVSGNTEDALRQIDRLRAVFGEHFFLELMSHGIPEEKVVAEALLDFGQRRGIGVVMTGDSHFTMCDHAVSHEVALAVGTRRKMNDPNRWSFPGGGYWFKSPQEMWDNCVEAGFPEEAYTNSLLIANLVEDYGVRTVSDGTAVHQVPDYVDGDGRRWGASQCHLKLRLLAYEGLQDLIAKDPSIADDPRYIERLEYELSVMERKNFSSYFLVIAGIIKHMWDELGILRPVGRGSSLGSLVCYCLGITALDPVRWNVPFYRFINEGRKDLPDVDTDISQRRRKDVLQFIADTYGWDNVALIATFTKMGAKSVMDKVGAALSVPPPIRRQVSQAMGEPAPDDTFADILEEKPRVRELMEGVDGWVEHCLVLDGNYSTTSMHAAGVVISNEPLFGNVPLMRDVDGFRLTQYDMDDLQDLGLLKLDMLGLKTMDLIQDTFDNIVNLRPHLSHSKPGIIRDQDGRVFLDFYHMPIEDEETYRMISGGDWVSVFQYDSHGMRRMAQQLRPEKLEHLMALNALYRPGPLLKQPIYDEKGEKVGEAPSIADQYIARRHGREPVEVWHPDLEEIMSSTYGLPLFQEQISGLSKVLAGFTDEEADEYRKSVGKKDAELFRQAQDKLIHHGVERGHSREFMESVAAKLEGFARYGWNSGHALSYSYLSFVTAYLECHYPCEYYTALLNQDRPVEKQAQLLAAVAAKGVEIVPPDINKSGHDFTTDGEKIWMGLRSVAKMGPAAVVPILYEREARGEFKSFMDFTRRTAMPWAIPTSHPLVQKYFMPGWDTAKKGEPKEMTKFPSINKTVRTNLIRIGAFSWDTSMTDRAKEEALDGVVRAAKKYNGHPQQELKMYECLPDVHGIAEFTRSERIKYEKEVLGFFVSGHPSHEYSQLLSCFATTHYVPVSPAEVQSLDVGDQVMILGSIAEHQMGETRTGNPYLRLTVADQFGETLVMVWSPQAEQLWPRLREDQPVMLVGNIREDRRSPGTTQFNTRDVVLLDMGIPAAGVWADDPLHVMELSGVLGTRPARIEAVPGWGHVARFDPPVRVTPERYADIKEAVDRSTAKLLLDL